MQSGREWIGDSNMNTQACDGATCDACGEKCDPQELTFINYGAEAVCEECASRLCPECGRELPCHGGHAV